MTQGPILPEWVSGAVLKRLGKVSDRSLSVELGVSKDEVGTVRRLLDIPPFQTRGLTPPRKKVLDALRDDEPRTVAQVTKDAYGKETPELRNLCKQVLYWLVDNGHAWHVRHGEYQRGVRPVKKRKKKEAKTEAVPEEVS